MKHGINREQALALVHTHLSNKNMVSHCLASEAVLAAVAAKLGEDPEKWALAGLLHDLDSEIHPDLTNHTKETVRILQETGVDAEIVEAIRLHNLEAWPGETRTSALHHALAAGETITGLIIASTLVIPEKKLALVKAKSVRNRYKEKAFARGANREIIAECELIGLPLAEFCELSLKAMQEIAPELGL